MGNLWKVVCLLALCTVSTLASPAQSSRCSVKESVHPPLGWVKKQPAPVDYVMDLRIALPRPNFHVLEQHLYEVSDPDHPRYGQHLSKGEVEKIVAPHPESVDQVDAWLAPHGLSSDALARSPAGDWVTIKVPCMDPRAIRRIHSANTGVQFARPSP